MFDPAPPLPSSLHHETDPWEHQVVPAGVRREGRKGSRGDLSGLTGLGLLVQESGI